jgi:hypothetical protein
MRIAACVADPTNAISLYRGIGPFSQMEGVTFHHVDATTLQWNDLLNYDVLFISKPYLQDHLRIVSIAKDLGKFVWVDFDDAVLDCDIENADSILLYETPEVRDLVEDVTARADVVTVSTEKLLEVFGPKNPVIVKVPNATMHTLHKKLNTDVVFRRNRMVIWRGGKHHVQALRAQETEIEKFLLMRKDLVMVWMGFWSAHLCGEYPSQNIFEGGKPWNEYFRSLEERRAFMQIVCLRDTTFSRSKSNNAWLESIMLGGSLCVAPRGYEEWNHPGMVLYGPGEMCDVMNEVASRHEDDLAAEVMKARAYIMDNFSLNVVNQLRREILNRVSKKA